MSPRISGRPGRRAVLTATAVAVPAALVAAALLLPTQAIGAVDLPDKSPAQLVEFAESSTVSQLSGTIEQTSDLGIPDLSALTGGSSEPGASGGADAADVDDLVALATGSYTAKVYLDGDRARVQVLDQLAERNVYVDAGAGVTWFVDSESKSATKLTAPDGSPVRPHDTVQTPDAMLEQALADLDDTTEVTVGTDGRVAGRDVYELVLTPRSDDTLVGSIRFAVDGENGTALAASVTARGADDPAFSVGFTDVSFSAPDASTLTFEPGSDIAVTTKSLPAAGRLPGAHDTADAPSPTVYGAGWSAVVELPASETGGLSTLTADQKGMLDTVTTAVDGGRVFTTSLVSVLLTDDGRVLAGAVPTDRLVQAAASGH